MDAQAKHFTTHDTSYLKPEPKFSKGVAVFDITYKDAANLGPRRISAGHIFVKEQPSATSDNQASDGQATSRQLCDECGQPGHLRARCPSRLCHECGNPGHPASGCQLRNTCHACGNAGHKRKDCQNVCPRCLTEGHAAADCCVIDRVPTPTQAGQAAATSAESVAPAKDEATPAGFVATPTEASGVPTNTTVAPAAGEASTDSEPAEDHGPPLGQFKAPESDEIEVKLYATTMEHHLSSVQLRLLVSYASENTASGRFTKEAILRTSAFNAVSPIKTRKISVDSPTESNQRDLDRLSAHSREKLMQLISRDSATAHLLYVS
ncbi:hypothetical protein PMIN05_012471 [Paraphaeosphaeria minitans]